MRKIAFAFLLISTICVAEKNYFEISKNSDIYNAVLRELEINYVDSLPHEKLTETAINSMLRQLDPYTIYIPKSDKKTLTMMTTGMYGGIGAIIMQKGDYVVISEPHEGMPAQRNGVLAGDTILQVNGENMKGKTVSEVSNQLRGIPGTEIRLKLKRLGEKRAIEKKFLREAIKIEPIEYYGVLKNDIGYISFTDFTENSAHSFKNALNDLVQNRQIKKLVVDLRNNGGGLVSEAIDIASLFVPKRSLIVTMKGKDAKDNRAYKTLSEPLYPHMPLVILVNEESASASEILAGALQDMDRAVIVGERTFGKGLVQNVRNLPHEGYLKVTTAKYYIPSGRCVQAINYSGDRKRIPDSLTTEFKTLNGRKVRDGGGISPDVPLNLDEKINISYYLFTKNILFDYATIYAKNHEKIAPPDTFGLSDDEYAEFVQYVENQNFTYQLESNKYLRELERMIKLEGYQNATDSTLQQLKQQLKPDVKKDMQLFKADILFLLENEIVKRYYFQRGETQFRLRTDKWVEKATELLENEEEMKEILSGN